MNPHPAIAAVPIQSVAPVTKLANDAKFESTGKPSASDSHQSASESLKNKHSKKKPAPSKKTGTKNSQRKNPNEFSNEANYDFSYVPTPFCSCTGVARRCYKYGPGGWQSTCCTTSLSLYPLPMNPSRPGRRVTGRKMKGGAYRKILLKLATEGHNLSLPIDLKNHWGKHGTNKFNIIK